jgi:hypothetical protein
MTFLFTRSVQLGRGNVLDATAWSVKMTEKVNAISETPVRLWTTVMSADVGRLTWTSPTEDLSTITVLQDKLLADSGYLDLVEEGTSYTNGAAPIDALVRMVHADFGNAASAKYSTLVRAVLAPGNLASGVPLGVEIATRAKAITGRPTSFGVAQTGVYGEVGWVALYDSIDEVQAAGDALAADAGFAKLLDDNAGTWLAGLSTQVISRRVA